jgi:hypothetical protein
MNCERQLLEDSVAAFSKVRFYHSSVMQGKGKGKGKVVPVFLTKHHAMTVYWGSAGIAPRIV